MAHPSYFPPRLTSTAAFNSSPSSEPATNRKLRLLVAATGPRDTSWAQALVVRLSRDAQIETRAIVDDLVPRLTQTTIVLRNQSLILGHVDRADDVEFYRQQAFELVEWADLMVCAPLDADGMSKMLSGVADTVLGEVLRGWDIRKTLVIVPGMSTHMWSNPVTKRQLSKLNRKWSWVRVITPILWHYEGTSNPKRVPQWNSFNEVLGIIKNHADLLGLGTDAEFMTGVTVVGSGEKQIQAKLPLEIWTIVLDCVGDWELAKALGIYSNLPMPSSWSLLPRDPNDALKVYEHELEWIVLTSNSAAICKKLSQSPPAFQDLPALVVKLIIRFALIEVLAYLEANRPNLFWAFEGTTLPTLASVFYPRIDILEYWKQSEWFKDRHIYDTEAVDGASKNGHAHILDWWWRQSGLPMRYTEAALEQASGKGQLPALEWWRDAAAQDEALVLRPGRALLWATQHGQVDVLRWWNASGVPLAHGNAVAKMASRWGRVDVLEIWRRLKGDMNFGADTDVLVSCTVHQHVEVLEWWRMFAHGELEGMEGREHSVEYRIHSIAEALPTSIESYSPVRAWWMQNGLDLSLGDEERQKARYL